MRSSKNWIGLSSSSSSLGVELTLLDCLSLLVVFPLLLLALCVLCLTLLISTTARRYLNSRVAELADKAIELNLLK